MDLKHIMSILMKPAILVFLIYLSYKYVSNAGRNYGLANHRKGVGGFSEAPNLCNNLRAYTQNQKVLSYSLFGSNYTFFGKYIPDISREAKASSLYSDWTIRIHHDKRLSRDFMNRHSKYQNVVFCDMSKVPNYGDLEHLIGTVYRFLPIADNSAKIVCSRDLDSPISEREEAAVKEFLDSKNDFHTMRDSRVHSLPILGGMWCYKNSNKVKGRYMFKKIMEMACILGNRNTENDQVLLRDVVWPLVKRSALQHDSYTCKKFPFSKPFPTQRHNTFVGCVRPCLRRPDPCPLVCRPKEHKNWTYC